MPVLAGWIPAGGADGRVAAEWAFLDLVIPGDRKLCSGVFDFHKEKGPGSPAQFD
jgi:hypothetical protein